MDIRKAAKEALEYICGARLCEVNSMSNRAEMLRLMDRAAKALRQALAQPEQEPFIYVREDNEKPFGGYEHCSEEDAGAFPVYTAPPKREWVGITDDEIYEFVCTTDSYKDFGKAIEVKLKEKNT